MFATTFLGHQGWLVQTDRACILIDPLLCEDFGHAHALGYSVYPPRVIEPAGFPPIDAVVLSHEHDDHFDIPSLARLDRDIPIYLSARSSSAARQILQTMGFTTHALSPGVANRFADLEVLPFVGDHVNVNCGDEWDTLPYLVRSTEGHGSLFSMVDITLTQRHVEWVAEKAARPGLVTWTNNAIDWSHMAGYLRERGEATQQCFLKMGTGHKLITTLWGTPAAMLMCAGGFYFTGDRAWMNQRVFCVDNDAVCAQMAKVYRKEKFVAALPGQTFVMQANKLKSIEPSTKFLSTVPRETWPSRAVAAVEVPDYAPATGRREITAAELERLHARLTEFAGVLVGSTLFKSLYSLLASEVDRTLSFACVVRSAEQLYGFAYAPSTCTFERFAVEAPDATYLAGIECWASDLLAVLDGELGPIALTYGRARLWNAHPTGFNFDIFGELYRTSHPLRRPAEYARTYDRLWRAASATAPVFRARHPKA